MWSLIENDQIFSKANGQSYQVSLMIYALDIRLSNNKKASQVESMSVMYSYL